MEKRQVIITAIVLVIVALFCILIYRSSNIRAEITSIEVKRPHILVYGKNLGKVEIWAVPTGTGVSETDHQKLGDAVWQETNARVETWQFTIPKEPILATEIFAKGFNKKSEPAGRVSLPEIGATAIHDLLWGADGSGDGTFEIGEYDTSRNWVFTETSRFLLRLNWTVFPKEKLLCIPSGIIGRVSNVPSDEYLQFEAVRPGVCTITVNNTKIATVRVVSLDEPLVRTIKNSDLGFEISYPTRDAYEGSVTDVPPTGEKVVRIDLPRNNFRSTNLSEAAVVVSVSKREEIVSSCIDASPNEKIIPIRIIDDVSFHGFLDTGAAAGNRYDEESYRVARGGACYAIKKYIHSTTLGNYPVGTVREFDAAAVESELDTIISSFVFL